MNNKKQNKAPVLLIVVDALRFDYLDLGFTPKLLRLREQSIYVKRLTPNFGYCEITEYFTGAKPDVTGKFVQFNYGPEKSPYRIISPIIKLLSQITISNNLLDHLMHLSFDNLLRRLGFKYPIYEIPFQMLLNLYLSEAQLSYYNSFAFGVESIFDVMRSEGKTFFKDTFVEYNWAKWNDKIRADKLINIMRNNFYDLFLLYLGELDHAGHFFKQNSKEFLAYLRQVDTIVFQVIKAFQEKYPDYKIIIMGDHGMVPVKTYVNFYKLFNQLSLKGLTFGKDYIAFLDSIMARFWTKTNDVLHTLEKALYSINFGCLLNPDLANELHVPKPNHDIGEIVWIADPGTVIYPDCFHTTKYVVGMHGYVPMSNACKGLAIILADYLSPNVKEEAQLIDICPTLCKLLDIRSPNKCQGKSLI